MTGLAAVLLLAAARAAAAPADVPEVETIVVTASRTGTPLRDIPTHGTIVTSTEIARIAPRSADELLQKAVGDAELSGSLEDSSLTRQFALRGVGDPSRTLVLLDGVPIQTPRNNWVDWQLLDPAAMERVEILRGPYSSVHGSGAMGGVMDFVTRTPVRANETSADASYGSFDTRTLGLRQAGKLGSWAYSVAGRAYHTDGTVSDKVPTPFSVARDRSLWTLTSKLVWTPRPGDALTFGYVQGEDTFNRGRMYYLEDRNDRVGYVRYDAAFGEVRLRSHAFLDYDREWQTTDKAPLYNRVDTARIRDMASTGGGAEATFPAGPAGALTAGLDGWTSYLSESRQNQTSTAQAATRAKQSYVAPFLQLERRALDGRLVATAGARLDWYRSFDGYSYDTKATPTRQHYPAKEFTSFNPHAGVVYHLDDETRVRAAAGKGFAAPTMNNLYTLLQKVSNATLPNPDLVSEDLWSYEAGADRELVRGVSGSFTFYQSFAKNLIDQKSVGGGNTQWINSGKVQTEGVEAQLDWTPAPAWLLRASYDLTRSKIVSSAADPATTGADFPYTSPNKALLSASYDEPQLFGVYVRARYKDHAYATAEHDVMTRAYWVSDVGASKRLGPATLRVDVDNVFDAPYESFDLSDTVLRSPGRRISGTVAVSF